MALLVFLNELSRPQEPLQPTVAKGLLDRLVKLLQELKKTRQDIALHSAEPLKDMSVGADYPLARWCNDGDCREEWRFLRALENRAPFGSGLEELGEPLLRVEYRFQGTVASGLGWAHLASGLAISFDHSASWQVDRVPLTRGTLQEDPAGDIAWKEEAVEAMHAAQPPHIQQHRAWLAQACRQPARDPNDLWQRRAELYPHLEFLPRVQAQLCELHPAHPWFREIAQRLEELDVAVGEWNPALAPTPAWRSHVTPEHVQRRQLCMFEDLDKQERCFDLHARFTPGAGRLHFRLDANRRKAIVAHAGTKLGI